MKITALCKTFRGEEFIEAMIRSIYDYVDHIVFVNSDLAWDHKLLGKSRNDKTGNTCKAVIERIKLLIDRYRRKIITLNYNTTSQFDQCTHGFEYIKNNLDCDFVMLIDTDEVWDDYNLSQAINYLKEKNDHEAIYRARLFTYIKKINYRVDPEEVMCPTIFVSTTRKDLGKNHRGCHLKPMYKMTTKENNPIFFHHFVYVRNSVERVLEKIKSSNGYENNTVCDLGQWEKEVWNKIPDQLSGQWANGFHPAIQFKKHWGSVKEIQENQLPNVFRKYAHLKEGFV